MTTATYNRIYSTMFDGSLYGKGALTIATWAYVLSEMKPDFGRSEFYVTLNPKKVADALGESQSAVLDVITKFCQPEEDSQSPAREGRKLVLDKGFDYLVVNGAEYNDIQKREARRESNRKAQDRYRKKGKPSAVEIAAAKLDHEGKPDEAARTLELDEKLREARHATNSPATLSRPSEKSSNASVRSPVRALEPPVPARITVPPTAAPQHRTLAEHQALRAVARGPQGVSHDQPPKLEQANQHVAPAIQPVAGPSTVSPRLQLSPSSNNSPSPSETPPAPSAGRRVQSTAHPAVAAPPQESSGETPASQGVQTTLRSSGQPISLPSRSPAPARSLAQVLPGALRQLPRRAVPPNALSGGWEERTVQTGQASSPKPSPAAVPEPAEEDLPEDAPFE